jgi:hypothetical protein
MTKRQRVIGIIVLVTFLPAWMFLTWWLWPKRKLTIAIVDKTVLTRKGQEHSSLVWLLTNQKFTKNNSKLYNIGSDYYGFFPKEKGNYQIKGLERFSENELQRLSEDADAAYITDAYGIYRKEWYNEVEKSERSSIIYGGLSSEDLTLMQKMKAQKKLIITEFNCMASPTSYQVREQFQREFGVHWTGWIGRFFDKLDTAINKEIPQWLVNAYSQQHNGKWPFTKAGIAFVSEQGQVEVVEDQTHLTEPVPAIRTIKTAREKYHLPTKVYYPFWFDIVKADATKNTIISQFEIAVNDAGATILANANIPTKFPAVQVHEENDYTFYYFSADFSDNPISLQNAYYKGIHYFKWMLANNNYPGDRSSFFWMYYEPLMRTILNKYYKSLH